MRQRYRLPSLVIKIGPDKWEIAARVSGGARVVGSRVVNELVR